MTELLNAAEAVINRWDAHHVVVDGILINALRAAVERAEKQEDVVGFEEWWEKNGVWALGEDKAGIHQAWTAAQQAERERIRARAKIAAEKTWGTGDWFVGPQHFGVEKFVEELLREDDT